MASLGAGGIWLMGGAWVSGMLGMLMRISGVFLSGYIYYYNDSMPWCILSGVLIMMGILFITLVREPERAEI
jgi:hypothetical protein